MLKRWFYKFEAHASGHGVVIENQFAVADTSHGPTSAAGRMSEADRSATSVSLARVEVDSVLLPSRNEGLISDEEEEDEFADNDEQGTCGCCRFK